MMNIGQQILCLRIIPKVLCSNVKYIHISTTLKVGGHEFREIKIPVPWGTVAGKWWGNPDAQPVFALHGVQDNAATFDKLAPLLSIDGLLALDLPGHGWSSHFPIGFPYDFMDGVFFMRFVINQYYKWTQPIVLLGHSFGSALSFVYSALYPDEVSKYISLDCARHQTSVYPNTIISTMRNTMEKILEYEEKLTPPDYTYEELFKLFYLGRKGLISEESCKVLLSRGITTLNNGKVHLSRDVRVKLNAFGRLTLENWLSLAPRIKCDVLSIQAENGTVKDNFKGKVYRETVEIIQKNSSKSRHVIIEGNHHVHLDNPEPVADEINKFISVSE